MVPGTTYTVRDLNYSFTFQSNGQPYVTLNGPAPFLSDSSTKADGEVAYPFNATLSFLDAQGNDLGNSPVIDIGSTTGGTYYLCSTKIAFANPTGVTGDHTYTQDLQVNVTHDNFTLAGTSGTIPYTLTDVVASGSTTQNHQALTTDTGEGLSWKITDPKTGDIDLTNINLVMKQSDAAIALAGTYSSTISFSIITL